MYPLFRCRRHPHPVHGRFVRDGSADGDSDGNGDGDSNGGIGEGGVKAEVGEEGRWLRRSWMAPAVEGRT